MMAVVLRCGRCLLLMLLSQLYASSLSSLRLQVKRFQKQMANHDRHTCFVGDVLYIFHPEEGGWLSGR